MVRSSVEVVLASRVDSEGVFAVGWVTVDDVSMSWSYCTEVDSRVGFCTGVEVCAFETVAVEVGGFEACLDVNEDRVVEVG